MTTSPEPIFCALEALDLRYARHVNEAGHPFASFRIEPAPDADIEFGMLRWGSSLVIRAHDGSLGTGGPPAGRDQGTPPSIWSRNELTRWMYGSVLHPGSTLTEISDYAYGTPAYAEQIYWENAGMLDDYVRGGQALRTEEEEDQP